MAQFYGGVHGNRGEATRMGHKTSGLNVYAKNWGTQVDVSYYHQDGVDCMIISVTNLGNRSRLEIYNGPETDIFNELRRI